MTFVTSFWADWRRQRKQSERIVSLQDLTTCSRSELLFLPINFLFPLVTVCLLKILDWTSVRQSHNLIWSIKPSRSRIVSIKNDWLFLKMKLIRWILLKATTTSTPRSTTYKFACICWSKRSQMWTIFRINWLNKTLPKLI